MVHTRSGARKRTGPFPAIAPSAPAPAISPPRESPEADAAATQPPLTKVYTRRRSLHASSSSASTPPVAAMESDLSHSESDPPHQSPIPSDTEEQNPISSDDEPPARPMLVSHHITPFLLGAFRHYHLVYDFAFQQWDSVLNLAEPAYPSLVQEFYTHAQCVDYSQLSSSVLGVDFTLTSDIICDILGIPNAGTIVNHPQFMPEEPLNLNNQIASVFGNAVQRRTVHFTTAQSSALVRITQLLISEILNPKATRSALMTSLDILIMSHLIRRIPLNLGSVILTMMIDCVHRRGKKLIYGSVLTLIFNHFGVPIADHDPVLTPAIEHHRLCRMHLLAEYGQINYFIAVATSMGHPP